MFSKLTSIINNPKYKSKLEMWANAQRDGHPAEYRWRRGALCSTPQSLVDAHY